MVKAYSAMRSHTGQSSVVRHSCVLTAANRKIRFYGMFQTDILPTSSRQMDDFQLLTALHD